MVNASCIYSRGSSTPSIPTKPVRGSQEWTKRVLELIDRDCINDFEELCELMGVPVMAMSDPTDDEQSMEAILGRIKKLHEEEQEQGREPEAARNCVAGRRIDQSRRPDPARN
jgi:hypothetical protein